MTKMKKNSMIIDVSCDRNGGIETSIPTTINNPIYTVDGVVHYAVDHTPALFSKTFTKNNSQKLFTYIDELVNETPGEVLMSSKIIDNGIIIDNDIIKFQHR